LWDALRAFFFRAYGRDFGVEAMQRACAEAIIKERRNDCLPGALFDLLEPLLKEGETAESLENDVIRERVMSGRCDSNYYMLCLVYNRYWKSQGYVITVVTDAGSV